MRPFKPLPKEISHQFAEAVFAGVDGFPLAEWITNPGTVPQPITREERVQGLAALWMEAEYSFPFWAERPNLDWDASFREFLPRVEAAQEPAEYYRLLRQFVALLEDGHSYVIPPRWVAENEAPPPLSVRLVEGQVVVTAGELPPGTVIEAVDGEPALQRLRRFEPIQAASTAHNRAPRACRAMLRGPVGSAIELQVRRPGHSAERCVLQRTGPLPAPSLLERVDLGEGKVLVRINSWTDPAVVDRFNEAFPDFTGVTALMIDLRKNGGGNSDFGASVLSRLIDRPVPQTISHRPLHWGGMSAINLHCPVLVNEDPPILPDSDRPRYTGPVAVLTSPDTFSAAEDFCVLFRQSGRGPLVGEPTAGSTGNPAFVRLPGGGIGAVCATRTTFIDGTDFVGIGVLPDHPVAPTIAGLTEGRDEVLERALQVL